MDSNMIFPQVNKSVELVQVLIYLAEEQEKTYQKLNNHVYVDNVFRWFDKYKSHKAVILTKNLIREKCFVHIRPLQAILSIDKITQDKRDALYDWANAVMNFAMVSDFERV